MTELNDILSKVGMNETELKVYQTIIAFGFHTAGQVSSKTGLSYQETLGATESLVEKNYLKKKSIKSLDATIYYAKSPKIAISSDLSSNLSSKLNQLSEKISNIWSNTEAKVDSDTANLITKVQNTLEDYSGQINEVLTASTTSLNGWTETLQQALKDEMTSGMNTFRTQVISPLEQVLDSTKSSKEVLGTQSNSSISEIKTQTEQHQQSIEEAVTSIKAELEEFVEEIAVIIQGQVSGTNKELEDKSSVISDNINNISLKVTDSVNSFKQAQQDSVDKLNTTLVDTTIETYTDLLSRIQTLADNHQDEIGKLTDSIRQSNNEYQVTLAESSGSLLSEFSERNIEHVHDIKQNLQSSILAIQENAVSKLSEILTTTTSMLDSLRTEISSNLGQYQKQLNQKLTGLSGIIDQDLKDRFSRIDELLNQFVTSLKDSAGMSVAQTNEGIIGLKNFFLDFLDLILKGLDHELDTLSDSVENDLEEIVKTIGSSIDTSVSENQNSISNIQSGIEEKINDFQSSVNNFLKNSKDDLSQRLLASQSLFKEGVQKGVEAYHSASAEINKVQAGQLSAINQEAESLSMETEKAKEAIFNVLDNRLNSHKNDTLEDLDSQITQDIDKITRELTRFNERLERDMRKFYDNFNDQTNELRNEVPQTIENLFTDQMDRLENFKREFERNRRFIQDFLDDIIQNLTPGDKNWRRKELQTEIHEKSQRMKLDFDRFEANIIEHFKFSIEDIGDVRGEVLDGYNRKIQDEINQLDQLIQEQEKNAVKITTEFLSAMSDNKNKLQGDMTASISDIIESLTTTIRKELLTKFEQPLESILAKAKVIATGTEGLDQENRILKTQNLLLDKINQAVDSLVETLQEAFDSSIENLDAKVDESIGLSQGIVGELQTNLNETFVGQNQTLNNFADTLKSELRNVQEGVNKIIRDTSNQTKQTVGDTFTKKSTEVSGFVDEQTQLLTSYIEKLSEDVDMSFTSFRDSLDTIREDTKIQVDKTITNSIGEQKDSLEKTIEELSQATENSKEMLSTTQSSLNEEVSGILSSTQDNVTKVDDKFTIETTKIKEEIITQINSYFDAQTHNTQLGDLGTDYKSQLQNYLGELIELQNSLKEGFESVINSNKSDQQSNLSHLISEFSTYKDSVFDELLEFVLDIFDQVSSQLSNLQGVILGSVENTKVNIDDTVTNSVETVRNDVLNPANEVVNTISENAANLETELESVIGLYQEILANKDTNLSDVEASMLDQLISKIEHQKTSLQEKLQAMYTDQQSNMSSLSEGFDSNIQQTSTEGKASVAQEIEKIPSVVEDTLDAAAQSMALLNQISAGAIELDLETPDLSYLESSKDAIVHNLNALLERTKSSVTIFSPTISWLDPNIIPSFTRATVRIVVDEDKVGVADREILNKFEEAGTTVSLRKFDRNRYGGDVDMIMAERDREEVILATPLNQDKPYAFISQDDFFINRFAEFFGKFQMMPEFKFS